MSEKKFGLSKNFAAIVVLSAVVVVLVILLGHNTFSGDNSGRLTVTEFTKEPLPRERNDKPALKQGGANFPKNSSPLNVNGDLSKAVLNVKGLSCSSCIQNIKDALSNIQGIEDILVDISRSTAQIYFNSKTLKQPDRLAEVVTSAGYPATLVKSDNKHKKDRASLCRSAFLHSIFLHTCGGRRKVTVLHCLCGRLGRRAVRSRYTIGAC